MESDANLNNLFCYKGGTSYCMGLPSLSLLPLLSFIPITIYVIVFRHTLVSPLLLVVVVSSAPIAQVVVHPPLSIRL